METYIVKVKKKEKQAFAEELLHSFDFLDVKKQALKKKVVTKKLTRREKELAHAFKEVQEAMDGKRKLKTLKEVINEL